MRYFKFYFVVFLLSVFAISSCVKIPSQSVDLILSIQAEGKRMHELNVALVNKMFKEKRGQIDIFIKEEYVPGYVENFLEILPEGMDLKTEFSSILEHGMVVVIENRDQMQEALETQRIKLIDQMLKDALVYEEACRELKYLLKSAVKLDKEKQNLYAQINQLSNQRIDLNELEKTIDKFIKNTGNVGEGIAELDKGVDALIR